MVPDVLEVTGVEEVDGRRVPAVKMFVVAAIEDRLGPARGSSTKKTTK